MKMRIYYVSEDLEPLIRSWCTANKLEAPSADLFESLRDALQSVLQSAFARPIEDEAAKEEFEVKLRYLKGRDLPTLTRYDGDQEFWIALDDVYIARADGRLRVARIYDEDGERIGVGSATGNESLETQLDNCVAQYDTKDRKGDVVVLADDGTYTGKSIVEIALKLKERGILVQRIKLGFSTREGGDYIYDRLDEAGFPPIEICPSRLVDKKKHAYVWVCERDFYLGVPRSGRTYGNKASSGQARPCRHSIAFPYVEPFAASRRGGDITHGITAFSKDQIQNSLRLWGEIERLNGTRFKVRDIPRFPGPGLEKEFEKYADDPWEDYVRRVAEPMFSDL